MIADLNTQIAALTNARDSLIAAFQSTNGRNVMKTAPAAPQAGRNSGKPRRTMSKAGRERISASTRQRWARIRSEKEAAKQAAAAPEEPDALVMRASSGSEDVPGPVFEGQTAAQSEVAAVDTGKQRGRRQR